MPLSWLCSLTVALALGPAPETKQDKPASTRSAPPPPSAAVTPAPRRGAPPPPPGSETPPPPGGDPTARAEPLDAPRDPIDLSDTWNFNRRSAPRPRFVRSSDPEFFAPNPVGFYSGVSLQGNHVPPFPAARTGTPPTLLTWTGFERTGAGSRVYFELSSRADFSTSQKGNTITIRIKRTKVNVRNNRRRLDLRYFNTPVQTIVVKRSGQDTIATISLRKSSQPQVQLVDAKAGYKLLVVAFTDALSREDPRSRARSGAAERTRSAPAPPPRKE